MYKKDDKLQWEFQKKQTWGQFKMKSYLISYFSQYHNKIEFQCFKPHFLKFIKVLNKCKTFEEYRLIIFGIITAIICLFSFYQVLFGNLLYIMLALPLLLLKNSKIGTHAKLMLIQPYLESKRKAQKELCQQFNEQWEEKDLKVVYLEKADFMDCGRFEVKSIKAWEIRRKYLYQFVAIKLRYYQYFKRMKQFSDLAELFEIELK